MKFSEDERVYHKTSLKPLTILESLYGSSGQYYLVYDEETERSEFILEQRLLSKTERLKAELDLV